MNLHKGPKDPSRSLFAQPKLYIHILRSEIVLFFLLCFVKELQEHAFLIYGPILVPSNVEPNMEY